MRIYQARTPRQLAVVRSLFEQYASWLGVDLCFQGFAAELAGLPGRYSPPRGRLLLAVMDRAPAGCVAMRPLTKKTCEMKRLFVRPAFRGQGVGRELAKRAIENARAIGYARMRLDTLASMQPAISLYEALGFQRCDPYYDTPLKDSVFMELLL